MTTYHLRGTDGTEVFTGTIEPPPGSGSQPGVLASAEMLFTEEATAGVYTGTLALPAKTIVTDIWVDPDAAPWAVDDTAVLDIGDDIEGPQAYLADFDLLSLTDPYDPDAPTNGTNFATWGAVGTGTYNGAAAVSAGGNGVRYPSGATITATLTTTLTSPPVVPSGVLRIKVIYFSAVTAVPASFA